MTYVELVAYVKKVIAEGKPLHGLARDIAIDLALAEKDKED